MWGNAEPIGQGKAKAKVFLEENPEIAAEIEAKLRQKLFDTDKGTADSFTDAADDAADEDANADEMGDDDSTTSRSLEPLDDDVSELEEDK